MPYAVLEKTYDALTADKIPHSILEVIENLDNDVYVSTVSFTELYL